MNELDTLRPAVREALIDFDSWMGSFEYADGELPRERFCIIRAELLRLAKENADLLSTIELDEQVWVQRDETMHRWIERARNAESELAALKARIFHGIVLDVDDLARGHAGLPSEWRGKRVRLFVEE